MQVLISVQEAQVQVLFLLITGDFFGSLLLELLNLYKKWSIHQIRAPASIIWLLGWQLWDDTHQSAELRTTLISKNSLQMYWIHVVVLRGQRFEQLFSPVFCTNSPLSHSSPLLCLSIPSPPSMLSASSLKALPSPCNDHCVLTPLPELIPIASGFPGLEFLLGSSFH